MVAQPGRQVGCIASLVLTGRDAPSPGFFLHIKILVIPPKKLIDETESFCLAGAGMISVGCTRRVLTLNSAIVHRKSLQEMRRPVAVERWRTGGCGKDGGREAVEKMADGKLWKRRRPERIGKRFAFPTLPQPRRLRDQPMSAMLETPKPGKYFVVPGLKLGAGHCKSRPIADRRAIFIFLSRMNLPDL
jgi:hypothetical protein